MRILGVLVFLSVLAVAYANLKDIGVDQQRVVPFQRRHLFRPVISFPCNLLLGPSSSTCVYHKLCVTLAGILKAAGCLLLLRVACVSLVRFHLGKAAIAGHIHKVGPPHAAKLTEIVQSLSQQPAASPEVSDSSDDPQSTSQTQLGQGCSSQTLGSEGASLEQQHAAQKKPCPSAAQDAATSLLQSGLGKLTAVLAVNHALTSLSVKIIVPGKVPAKDLQDLSLPIATLPASSHLLSSARLALSSALHRCFPGHQFNTPAAPQKGWQVPSTPYVPINYNGVSFANWASAMFCKKRSSRPPKAPVRESSSDRALSSGSTQQRRRQRTSSVFPVVPVPAAKLHHHLTTATAPGMTAQELVSVNRLLDEQLDDVTSFLFD